jgi:hypothetical protein
MFPMVPDGVAKQAFQLLGVSDVDQLCILPLVSGERTIGALLIWGSDRGKFVTPPETAFKGKTVRVTGKITAYRGTPEIVVNDPTQIIVDESQQRLSGQATPIIPPSGTVAKVPETARQERIN